MSGETLATSVGGRVIEVNAREGDHVRAGDVLLRLDTERLDNEIARLERQAQTAREELDKVRHMMEDLEREKQSAVAKAESEIAETEQNVRSERERHRIDEEKRRADEHLAGLAVKKHREKAERLGALVRKGVVPEIELVGVRESLGEAEGQLERTRITASDAAVRLAEGRVKTARLGRELVERQFALRLRELEVQTTTRRGELEASKKSIDNLRLERDQATLSAHVDGIVTLGDVKVGDLLTPGNAPFAIAQEKGFRVDAAVKTGDAGLLREGMKARIKLDAYDYQKYGAFEGEIYFISPDSEVTELPEGGKLVYYVVRIRLDRDEIVRGALRGKVKLGMQGTVEILTGEERILSLAFRKLKDKVAVR